MSRVRFEPTIPVIERAKMVHALGRAAAVIVFKQGLPIQKHDRCSVFMTHTTLWDIQLLPCAPVAWCFPVFLCSETALNAVWVASRFFLTSDVEGYWCWWPRKRQVACRGQPGCQLEFATSMRLLSYGLWSEEKVTRRFISRVWRLRR
jgi:hypothetical protein